MKVSSFILNKLNCLDSHQKNQLQIDNHSKFNHYHLFKKRLFKLEHKLDNNLKPQQYLKNKKEKYNDKQAMLIKGTSYIFYMLKKVVRQFHHLYNLQKNEKQFGDFLRKTYNFEPPQKQEGPSKKGLLYLQKREENDDLIKKLTNSVLSPQSTTSVGPKEVPLDQVVSQMFEKQLERFPRVRSRIEKTQ